MGDSSTCGTRESERLKPGRAGGDGGREERERERERSAGGLANAYSSGAATA